MKLPFIISSNILVSKFTDQKGVIYMEKLSLFGLYGDLTFFKEKLCEGFKEVAFGRGEWVGDQSLVAIWAFYKPDGKIATLQFPKGRAPDGCTTVRGAEFEKEFKNPEVFESYCRQHLIQMGPKFTLAETIRQAAEA
jgi:hypothetical protein